MRTSIAVLALAIAWPAGLVAQEAGDSAGITQAALDYIEGWYEGNADRMTRALHPDLVKRIVADRGGSSHIQGMTAEQLIGYTAGGGGRNTPEEKRRTEVRILDVFGNAASVRVDAAEWIDYLQIGKVDGEWKILNVLWEFRPEVKAKMMERQKQAED
jgi:hypothetical protein